MSVEELCNGISGRGKWMKPRNIQILPTKKHSYFMGIFKQIRECMNYIYSETETASR